MAKHEESFEVMTSNSLLSDEDREQILANPGFGTRFSDHMAISFYGADDGWHDSRITAHDQLQVSPAMMVFHYGQAIFEGLKAYRTPDGELVMFRPEMNARRFNKSAIRMSMPEIPVEMFVQACEKLVKTDENWVPKIQGQSLYLRPFMVASESHLGLRAANEYLFIVIASPVAPFFADGDEIPAIKVFATDQYVRAVRGGTGFAKCSGNYAASLIAKKEAEEYGCQDVLWRDAIERKYVEEMGTSNICFVEKDGDEIKIYTPEVSSTILDGITRDSVLQLARDRGYEVIEGPCEFEDVISKIGSGKISEVFSCGTAVTITPIGTIVTAESETVVGDAKAGEITLSLRQELIDIQTGKIQDNHNWRHKI